MAILSPYGDLQTRQSMLLSMKSVYEIHLTARFGESYRLCCRYALPLTASQPLSIAKVQ